MGAHQEGARAARTRVRVDQFPVGSRLMNTLMSEVIAVAKATPELRHKLFQARQGQWPLPLTLSTRLIAGACPVLSQASEDTVPF